MIPLVSWTEEFDVLAKGRRIIFYDPRSRGQDPERFFPALENSFAWTMAGCVNRRRRRPQFTGYIRLFTEMAVAQ